MGSWNADAFSGALTWCPDGGTPGTTAPPPQVVAGSASSGYSNGGAADVAVASASAEAKTGGSTTGGGKAEDLFADWYGDSSAPDPSASAAREDGDYERQMSNLMADDEGEDGVAQLEQAMESMEVDAGDDVDDYETAVAKHEKVEDDIERGAELLSKMLCDNEAFIEACEAAFSSVAAPPKQVGDEKQLWTVADLKKALNHICQQVELEDVDDEEANDLFDGPMEMSLFYSLAKEFFSSWSRTLTMGI